MQKQKQIYIWIIICSMATFFTFARNGDGMNFILIGVMAVVPFALIFPYPMIKKNENYFFLLYGLMLFAGLRHYETFRLSTVLYSLMYILTFLYYFRLLNKNIVTVDLYLKIITFLIWAFFVVMVVQQLCMVLNIPIFNYRVGEDSTTKFNSLASEPSYFGKIITLLMLSYISVKEIYLKRTYDFFQDIRLDKKVWFIFFYQMLFCGSSFAIVLLLIILLKYVKFKVGNVFIAIFLSSAVFIFIMSNKLVAVERVSKIVTEVVTFNEDRIFDADQSGAFRIVPTILYIKKFDIFDVDLWLGKGVDYTGNLMPTLMQALDDVSFNVGLFPSYLWDYGLICTFMLIFIIFKFSINKKSPIEFVLWFVIILDAPFNTQLFWITFILMTTNKFLQNKYYKIKFSGNNKKYKTTIYESNSYA